MNPRTLPPADLLRARRCALALALSGRDALLVGHRLQPRNYLANVQPFRQDSTFLFFFGWKQPDAAGIIHRDGRATLFVPKPTPSDALWHGEAPAFATIAQACGVDEVRDIAELEPGPWLCLPVAEPSANAWLSALVGRRLDPRQVAETGDPALADAVITLRLRRDAWDVDAMTAVMPVTARAHRAAMAATRPGVTEYEVSAAIEMEFQREGCATAYPSIVTARGEVLHGHPSERPLRDGDLLLVDAGAEGHSGLATDVTRTWPVSGRWEGRQREVYEAVLATNRAAIAAARPGVRYRDLHLAACRTLTQSLVDWGLLRGDVDGLVEQGAHAVFFPHGLGHLLGHDVHDLELFGDRAGYGAGRVRSEQFGLCWLRLDRDLEPGFVVTIEPGLYFVPAILHSHDLRVRLGGAVRWDEAELWLGLGGVRIEDDVLITVDGPRVLSEHIPKDPDDLAALVGVGP